MNVVIGVLAFVGMLAIIASIVLAGIAAVVEILPPLRNPDADDHAAGTSVAMTVRSRHRLMSSRAQHKPRMRLSH